MHISFKKFGVFGWLFYDAAVISLFYAVMIALTVTGRGGGGRIILLAVLPGIVVCYLTVQSAFGVYETLWRYADVDDFFGCFFSATAAGGLLWAMTSVLPSFLRLPAYCYPVLTVEISFSLIVSRYLYRNQCRRGLGFRHNGGKRVLVVGAGQAASTLIAEMKKNIASDYLPVCAVDDDLGKVGMSILRTPIVGTIAKLPQICERYAIDNIIIAIPSLGGGRRGRILELCQQSGCRVLTLPNLHEMMTTGGNMVSRIRQVGIDELLGRDPVELVQEDVRRFISGKRVMVTGGGGSIGSELCRQIAGYDPLRLIIVDISENSTFMVEQELRPLMGDDRLAVHIASVRDGEKLARLMFEEKPDIVFHAAAHKHVPLMENAPEEAIKNNVTGTLNAARAAARAGVERFVLISTDKAVNPTSVMGATKRLCELAIQAMDKISTTAFVAVRFGNVLDSAGSAVPTFRRQIAAGGPVTVTHPEISRYFMTIPEAVQLLLTAASSAVGGEIFILDMGKPIKIKELAENLIRLSGFRPYQDIKIVYTGLRPGEKMYEELTSSPEDTVLTAKERIYVERPACEDEPPEAVLERLDSLSEFALIGDYAAIIQRLKELVPGFDHDKHRKMGV